MDTTNFKIEIKQTWSEEVIVNAKNVTEAKKLAWEKWKAKKSNYNLFVEKEPE
jgi:hypothetical protein